MSRTTTETEPLARSTSLSWVPRGDEEARQVPRGAAYEEECKRQGFAPLSRGRTMNPPGTGKPPRSPGRRGNNNGNQGGLQRTRGLPSRVDLRRMNSLDGPPPGALQRASSIATSMLRRTNSGRQLGGDRDAVPTQGQGRPPPGMGLRRTNTLDPTMLARARLRRFEQRRSTRRARDEREGAWLAALESRGLLGVGARLFPELARYSSRLPLSVRVRRGKGVAKRRVKLGARASAADGRLDRYSTGPAPLATGAALDADAQAFFGAAIESSRDLTTMEDKLAKYATGPAGVSAGATLARNALARYSTGDAPLRAQPNKNKGRVRRTVPKDILSKYSSVRAAAPTNKPKRAPADVLAKYSSRLPMATGGSQDPEVQAVEAAVDRIQQTQRPPMPARFTEGDMGKYSTGARMTLKK